jgi:hypothetical protein
MIFFLASQTVLADLLSSHPDEYHTDKQQSQVKQLGLDVPLLEEYHSTGK